MISFVLGHISPWSADGRYTLQGREYRSSAIGALVGEIAKAASNVIFTWAKDSRLVKAKPTASTTINYTYDVDGTRIGKTVGTTAHKYYVQDGKIVAETWGGNTLEFFYDEKGEPFALIYNGAKYYYVTNLQGNVVRIINPSGVWVANYTYDAWGNVISSSGERIKDINPLRYRGYYYDTETGLYYLNSRYYDPVTCRFINADDTDVLNVDQGNLLQYNLFAYCLNNPVNMTDDGGDLPLGLLLFVGSIPVAGQVMLGIAFTLGIVYGAVGIVGIAKKVRSNYASKKQQKIDAKKGISSSTSANPQPGPPKNNQDQNRQAKEAGRKYNLSKEGRELLHRRITKQNMSRSEIFKEAASIAKLGGKYVIK